MISCAYALLFFNEEYSSYKQVHVARNAPKKLAPDLGGLVILGDGVQNSFYGAYQYPSNGVFPTPDPASDIVTTHGKILEENTRSIAYCSPTLSSRKIIETLVHEQTPISITYNPKSDPASTSEEQCWNSIKEDWNLVADSSSSKPPVLAQNEKCTSIDIIRLAHQGFLSVSGIYKVFAPRNEVGAPEVKITNPMDFKEMVTPKQVLGTWNKGKSQTILAWYFGHLHIFELDPRFNMWWPVTKVNKHQENGAIILEFMRVKMDLFGKLNRLLRESRWLSRVPKNCLSMASCNSPDDKDKINQILAEIGDLSLGISFKYPDDKCIGCFFPNERGFLS